MSQAAYHGPWHGGCAGAAHGSVCTPDRVRRSHGRAQPSPIGSRGRRAYLTASEEAQEIEDALRELHDPADPTGREEALATLAAIDERLKKLTVPYEEWEVLYRQRLQVERDLLRIGTIEPPHERSPVSRIVEKVADLIS
jgi:hypothetical protein